MLTSLNPLTLEEVFNGRFPKIFIDRVTYREEVNQSDQKNSMLTVSIDSHLYDFKNSNGRFNLIEDEELVSSLVYNALFVKNNEYDSLDSTSFFKFSDTWINKYSAEGSSTAPEKLSFSLLEMLAFDLNETDKIPKSIVFDDSEVDVYSVPLKTITFSLPASFENSILTENKLKLFTFFSFDETELRINIDNINKGTLSTFFGGVNQVDIIENSRINEKREAFYNPETEKFWQQEVIYTSLDVPKAVSEFSPSEIASKYYQLVNNIDKELTIFKRKELQTFIADIKMPFFSTKKDANIVKNLNSKVQKFIKESLSDATKTRIVNRLISFISGVDTQLEPYPNLEIRLIGDGRIQRSSLSFLDQPQIARNDEDVSLIKESFENSLKRHLVTDIFYSSDDDGSAEVFLVLNKTNMMKYYSPFYVYFPNLESFLPASKGLFSIRTVEVTRDHYYSSDENEEPSNITFGQQIGTFNFRFIEADARLNDYKDFTGNFKGQREREQLVVETTEQTVLEGVTGVSESEREVVENELTTPVYETVEAITTGVAARLYTPNQEKDELILLALNDQSVNASKGDTKQSKELIVKSDDPLDETDGNLSLFLHYRFETSYIDRTAKFLVKRLESLENIIEELTQYSLEAQEKCAFNDITSVFNDYFIDQQYRNYSNLAEAPWNSIPSSLSYHIALFNTENVDIFDVKRNAIEIKKLLDPKTGNLDSIETVLNSAVDFKNSLIKVLENIGAMHTVVTSTSKTREAVDVSGRVRLVDEAGQSGGWFKPRISQYTGVSQNVTRLEDDDRRTDPPPNAEEVVGIFVQALSGPFKDWYGNLPTGKADTRTRYIKFNTVMKYIVNNRRTLGIDTDKGRLKLNSIAPWRNRSGRSAWKNKTVSVRPYLDTAPRVTLNMSDFFQQSIEFPTGPVGKDQAYKMLTYYMIMQEGILGDYGGDSMEMRAFNPGSNSWKHDQGYGSNSDQHIWFFNGDTSIAPKTSHADFLTEDAEDHLGDNVFKQNKSGVQDRDGLWLTTKGYVEHWINNKGVLEKFLKSYLLTILETFNEFIIDGEDIIPSIASVDITNTAFNNREKEIFKKIYKSGFYPWPGFPEIPSSLDATRTDLFG